MSETNGQSHTAPEAATAVTGGVSFSELVRAHYRWARQLHSRTGAVSVETEEEYRRKLAEFEHEEGEIQDAYWCLHGDASAVALTVKEHRKKGSGIAIHHDGHEPVIRLHRVTDWVTEDMPEIAELLHHCDTLAIKVSEVLEGTAKRVAMQWILSVQSHLLGFTERNRKAKGRVSKRELDRFVAKQTKELLQIEDYYQRAGQKRARQSYVHGMIYGVLGLPFLAGATAALIALFHALDLNSAEVRTFFACFAAGALGAVVSVLSRMAGKRGGFTVDHEIGKRGLHWLGSYRPLIGAIFGLAVYFVARTTLLQIDPNAKTFYFFVIVSFLAGFSERWTQVVLGGAEQTIAGSLGGGEAHGSKRASGGSQTS